MQSGTAAASTERLEGGACRPGGPRISVWSISLVSLLLAVGGSTYIWWHDADIAVRYRQLEVEAEKAKEEREECQEMWIAQQHLANRLMSEDDATILQRFVKLQMDAAMATMKAPGPLSEERKAEARARAEELAWLHKEGLSERCRKAVSDAEVKMRRARSVEASLEVELIRLSGRAYVLRPDKGQ